MHAASIEFLLPAPAQGLPHLLQAEQLSACQDVFPDERRWLLRLGEAFGQTTLPGLMRALGYQLPPEMLSAFLCLYCGKVPGPQDVFCEPSPEHVQVWQRTLEAYYEQHRLVPHPAVLAKLVLAGQAG